MPLLVVMLWTISGSLQPVLSPLGRKRASCLGCAAGSSVLMLLVTVGLTILPFLRLQLQAPFVILKL